VKTGTIVTVAEPHRDFPPIRAELRDRGLPSRSVEIEGSPREKTESHLTRSRKTAKEDAKRWHPLVEFIQLDRELSSVGVIFASGHRRLCV
jgi:hypothetical protein